MRMQLTRLGLRLFARAIDAGVIAVAVWLPALWIVFDGHLGPDDGVPAGWILVPAVFVYETALVRLFGGSVGKLATGLRVTDAGGARLSWGRAALRSILVGILIFGWPLILVFAFRPVRAAIHSLTGTVIVLPSRAAARSSIPVAARISVTAGAVLVMPVLWGFLVDIIDPAPLPAARAAVATGFVVSSVAAGLVVGREHAVAGVAAGMGFLVLAVALPIRHNLSVLAVTGAIGMVSVVTTALFASLGSWKRRRSLAS